MTLDVTSKQRQIEALTQEVDRLLADPKLARSRTLCELLRFLRDRFPDRGETPTTEYVIAQDLLGRDERFDPQIDPIVRVRVRRLREALSVYYGDEGGPPKVSIPARSYDLEIEMPPEPAPPVRSGRVRRNMASEPVLGVVALLAVFAICLAIYSLWQTGEDDPYPLIRIEPMQNLSEETNIDLLEAGLRRQLGSDLQKFGRYRIFIAGPSEQDDVDEDFTLAANILAVTPEVDLTFRLTRGSDASLVFGGRVVGPVLGQDYYTAISDISRTISAQIAGQGGPLLRSEADRTDAVRAALVAGGGVSTDVFRCITLEELFFDHYATEDFVAAYRCFEQVPNDIADDPVALSSWGTLAMHTVPQFQLMQTETLPADMIWDAQDVLTLANSVAQRFPHSGEALLLLGSVQNVMGARHAARISLQQATNLNPGNYTAYAVLAYLELVEGDFRQSVALSQQAVRLSAVPQSYMYFPLFAGSLALGNTDEAIAAGRAFADGRDDNTAKVTRLMVARLTRDRGLVAELSPQVEAMETPLGSVVTFVRGDRLRDVFRNLLPEVDFDDL